MISLYFIYEYNFNEILHGDYLLALEKRNIYQACENIYLEWIRSCLAWNQNNFTIYRNMTP